MKKSEYDYFQMSLKESTALIFWTSFVSVSATSIVVSIALYFSR